MNLRHLVIAAALGAGCSGTIDSPTKTQSSAVKAKQRVDGMSAMGRIAAQHLRQLAKDNPKLFAQHSPGNCTTGEADCPDEDNPFVDPDAAVALASGQAETSIAVDSTGQHVVIGYNDFRGFSTNPLSVSGVLYSDDGGKTFVDGGQLPSPGTDVVGTAKFPEIFGDPTVKYLGGCSFVYGSILMTTTAQTMGVHRSTDCGHTWQGPFEVTAATRPTSAGDAADKEFLDVDPETGRVMISWTNFAATGPQIRTAFSDDVTAAAPTWSAGTVVSAGEFDGQGSMPAFARRSSNAYVAWARFHNEGSAIGFSRSSDNGATWSDPIELGAPFFFIDQILGNDRVHQFPSVAVDNSRGRHHGSVYVVHATNDNHDGADIAFHRSVDGGLTFEPAVILNSRPGHDRAQWFPSVSVDDTIGRIYVMYYDQGVATAGDLTQTSYTFSDDGGVTWTRPRALTDRPFHAAWGNDTGQPNIGDYIQGAALDGDLYSAYAVTHPVGFTDGEPASGSFTVPDVEGKHTDLAARFGGSATLQAGDPTFTESGHDGNIDPGDVVTVQIPLTNYVTNPINAVTLHDVAAWADTTADNVGVLPPFKVISTLRPGATATLPVMLFLGKNFVAGTPIDIALHVVQGSPLGFVTLHATVDTGTRVASPLFAENFDGVAAGALPAGWVASHAGGANTVKWTTSSTFCGAKSNGAFHVNAADGPVGANGTPGNPTRWERLLSPAITVPADAGDVTLEFDVCYDTEDDPSFNVLAYDGFFLRIFDGTAGHLARSVLVDAFQSKFTTGGVQGYPKHFPRGSGGVYFEDMSAWAGDSAGMKHVKLRLPGMAGTTVQLRWEYTQDGGGICSDVRPGHDCGVLIDNIVMKSEKLATP
ncbi:MAG: glycosyl hydrolase, repeat-containing protein [bacterium]|nr:glycosyl hydrolase, repeat-containing protein [bacterium]